MKTIAYDAVRKRPGCVLLQAALGATISNREIMEHFDTEDWLLAPTDDMKVYEVTPEQLVKLGAITVNGRAARQG